MENVAGVEYKNSAFKAKLKGTVAPNIRLHSAYGFKILFFIISKNYIYSMSTGPIKKRIEFLLIFLKTDGAITKEFPKDASI
jgi:hypothetical protein